MDPIADMAQKKAEERRKTDKTKEAQGGLLSPGVIKGAFVAALVALFVAGVLIQFERNKASDRNDPAAAMRREMGMMNLEGNTAVPTSAFQQHLEGLASGNRDLRLQSMEKLLAENPMGAYPVIRGLLGDKDPAIRVRAAQIFGERKVPGYGVSLVVLLEDPVPEVREAAASSLKSYTDEAGVLYLLTSAVRSSDPAVALNALETWKAFSRTDEAAAVRVIAEALRSPDDRVVVAAIHAALNGLTTEYLKAIREDVRAVEVERQGTPAGGEAKRAGAFIDRQNL